MHSAVDGEDLTRDVRSIIRAEEGYRSSDIFRLSVTLERDEFKKTFLLLVCKDSSHGSLDESRCYRIECDVP